MEVTGVILAAEKYLERAGVYYSNYDHERQSGDKGKASEELWGVISCLLRAYYLLLRGEPLPQEHKALVNWAREVLAGQPDGEGLYRSFRDAEKLHANFYHMFIQDDELNEIWARVQALAVRLEDSVKTELKKVQTSLGGTAEEVIKPPS
jgi:hypothetical protein